MSRALKVLCVLLLTLPFATQAFAIAGATDRKPAASLLVPFLETGIDVATNPQDTLLVVTSTWIFPVTIHYHVWDIDGNPTALYGNIALGSTWSTAMRDQLNASTPAVRAQLTDGAFYRGFVTIDLVTAATSLNPRQAGYPFDNSNFLEGQIYYTRLSQGSANGLAMVPIESVNPATFTVLQGFYTGGDGREEIDSTARVCTQTLSETGICEIGGEDADIDRFHLRIFRSTPLNGSSRAVVFTWIQGETGGPSVYCDANPCASDYLFRQYNEAGSFVQDTTIRLDHVVNLIPNSALLGAEAGYVSIWDVPNCKLDTQVYAFSFNSANPVANPSLTWDAIFEGFIVP